MDLVDEIVDYVLKELDNLDSDEFVETLGEILGQLEVQYDAAKDN
jgi:hypothetical protein